MSFDPQLDALLRDVPLPGGLVARLKSSLVPTEEELDALLRQVDVPAGLVRQLHEIPGDEPVDEKLREVTVPFEVVWRARRRSWSARIRRAVQRAAELTTALLLFLCVSAVISGATGAIVASIYPEAVPPDEPAFVVASNSPLEFDAGYEVPEVYLTVAMPSVAEGAQFSQMASATRTVFDIDQPETPSWSAGGPVARWFSALKRGRDPLDNFVLMRWGVLGYPQYGEEVTPPLESPQFPAAAGIEPPPVRGYDRSFALRHGVFPPVRPVAHPALAAVALPLAAQSTSYQNVEWLAQQRRWPAASQVRTEEFLAAMDYQLPPASPGELAIRTAAGPSAFGPPGTGLVQIAAVAGALPRSESESSHLVLAIDMSQSMARGQRLELVRQSIDRLLTHVGPHDRLSLVVFDEEVRFQVERATAGEGNDIRRLLDELRPSGGTDLAQGLQQAAAVALAEDSGHGSPVQIVLITDSRVAMPPKTQSLVTEVLATAAEAGVRLDVLDVGDQPDVDDALAGWAEMMHGDVRRPQTVDRAAWLLIEALYGRSPVVASEARMTLRFSPRAVAAYRLIGHEANSLAALQPAALAVELRAGEVASNLVEIWFQANDENDVGEVELTWRDPASGREHRRTQRISRIQFAPTWEQSPMSLQQAALAAETAEVLRGSRVALRELGLVPRGKGNLDGLLETAASVHPRLAERPDFRNWLALVRQLSQIRSP